MRADLRYLLAGLAGTAAFTFLALAFPNLSQLLTIPAAVACFGLTSYFVWPDIREFLASPRWGLKQMWPQYLMIICGIGFFVGLVAFLQFSAAPSPKEDQASKTTPDPTRPRLKLEASLRDVQVRWPRASLFGRTDDENSPFLIKLRGLSSQKAIDIELHFQVSDDITKLRDALKAALFSNLEQQENGDWKISSEFVLGKPTQTTFLGFQGENLRRVSSLDDKDATLSIAYPVTIQNELRLFALWHAAEVGKIFEQEFKQQPAKTQQELENGLRTLDRASILPLPTVTVTISYKGLDGKAYQQKETIRSIYRPISTPKWVYEDVRQEKLFFEGGMGLIGFEDKANPDDGQFAQAKRQGLIKATD